MEIKTWVERCNDHPDHQTGMVSNDMIRARMGEEIADLRIEVERLRAENEQKQWLIDDARVHRNDLRAEIERTFALLKDPNVVSINMLRGIIAMPSVEQIKHIYASVFDERDEALEEKP